MADKKKKFSLKKIFFMKSFFSSLVGKVELTDKPLNWVSIIFLIAFDIFIFVNIIDGLDNVSKNITSPYIQYSYDCKEIFNIEGNLKDGDFKIIDKNNSNVITKNINAPFYDETFIKKQNSKYCQNIDIKLSDIKNNGIFNTKYDELQILKNDLYSIENRERDYKREYDKFVNEYKAGLTGYNDRLSDIENDSIRLNYEKIVSEIKSKQIEIDQGRSDLNNNKEIILLKKYILNNKSDFLKEVEKYKFWYPVYVTGMESLLIIPILLLSLFLYKFALRTNRRILLILSSNLALIAGIFTFIILFKIVYWIMPKKFFANLLIYLASIKALAVWNYLLTIFGLILFGALIYGSQKGMDKYKKIKDEQIKQKELLNKERITKERYWKKACIDCNTKLLEGATHCSNCGINQYKECSKCKKRMPKAYIYCEKCGTKN